MRESILSSKPGVCIERARYLTESYKQTTNQPALMRRALADANILEKMSIYILPGSNFVCNHASKPLWAPLYPEFDMRWMEEELILEEPYPLYERPADKFQVDKSYLQELKEILEYWRGNTHTDRLIAILPENARKTHFKLKAVDIGAYFQGGDGHYSPDHRWLFSNGLQKVIDMCQKSINNLDWKQADAVEKKLFYEAAIIVAKAVINFANRYSKLALELAETEENLERKQNLIKIADICQHVPQYPARNFREALQFILFVHFAVQIEDNGAGISIGRYDQILWDLYKQDIESGNLTYNEALELTENFYLQIYSINKVRSWEDTDYFRGCPMFQNLTIGGQDPKTKADATNDLSYICLEACANARVPQPSLTVRYHRKTPYEFKVKVTETIRLGMGVPSLFNDEMIIPAMVNRGYSLDDAYDYCIIGCVEPGVSGLLGGRTGGAWLNLGKIFEMSLYNGKDPRTGIQLQKNKNEKDLSTFTRFEEAYEAFIDQVDYYTEMEAILENTIDTLWEHNLEEPLAAIFGCPTTTIPRGTPIKRGGAKYDYTGQQTIGTANVANSLMSIKYNVFDKKILTGSQVKHALESNYQDMSTDPSGKEVRAICINVPKYGNDIDEVDFLARDLISYVAQKLTTFKNTRFGRGPIGCTIHCSTSTVSSNTPFGKVCGATPDGRYANEPLAEGQSPMRGTDKTGPTATLASVSKINNVLLSCGSLFNQKYLPEDFR